MACSHILTCLPTYTYAQHLIYICMPNICMHAFSLPSHYVFACPCSPQANPPEGAAKRWPVVAGEALQLSLVCDAIFSLHGRTLRAEDKMVQTYRRMFEKAKQTGSVIMEPRAAELFPFYQAALHTAGAVDFSDLVPMALELLRRRPKLLESTRPQHVVVDEAQDMSHPQRTLCLLLAGADIYQVDTSNLAATSIATSAATSAASVTAPSSAGTAGGLTVVGDDDRTPARTIGSNHRIFPSQSPSLSALPPPSFSYDGALPLSLSLLPLTFLPVSLLACRGHLRLERRRGKLCAPAQAGVQGVQPAAVCGAAADQLPLDRANRRRRRCRRCAQLAPRRASAG